MCSEYAPLFARVQNSKRRSLDQIGLIVTTMSPAEPERTFRPFLTDGVNLPSTFKMPDYAVVQKQARLGEYLQ